MILSLGDLNDDVLSSIIGKLPIQSVGRMSQVARRFRELLIEDAFWAGFCQETLQLSPVLPDNVPSWHSYAKSQYLVWRTPFAMLLRPSEHAGGARFIEFPGDDLIISGGYDKTVKLSDFSGRVSWAYKTDDTSQTAFLDQATDVVYIGTKSGTLSALYAGRALQQYSRCRSKKEDGSLVSTRKLSKGLKRALVHDGTVYVMADKVVCLSRDLSQELLGAHKEESGWCINEAESSLVAALNTSVGAFDYTTLTKIHSRKLDVEINWVAAYEDVCAAAGDDGHVKMVDLRTNELIASLSCQHNWLWCAAIDARQVVGTGGSGSAQIFDRRMLSAPCLVLDKSLSGPSNYAVAVRGSRGIFGCTNGDMRHFVFGSPPSEDWLMCKDPASA